MSLSRLRLDGRTMLAGNQPIQLRGIGLGNWMLIEHFMIGLPQVDWMMRLAFREQLGPEHAAAFWDAYMDSYITKADIARIAELGFNHVRLPFSYRHFESDWAPGVWLEEGFHRVDQVIAWCRAHGLYVLLDLHAVPGCQAADWNADSEHGQAEFWDVRDFQDRAIALWREFARRYCREDTVAGYEILNEPVTLFPYQVERMNRFNRACLAAIRAEDPDHIVVINGDKHATDLRALDGTLFDDPQVMAAFHYYHQYSPPFREIRRFPGRWKGKWYDQAALVAGSGMDQRSDRERIPRPEFMGEFGIHYGRPGDPTLEAQRAILCATIRWCNDHGVHWNLWHWKDVAGMGLLRLVPGKPWLDFLSGCDGERMASAQDRLARKYLRDLGRVMPLAGKSADRLHQEAKRDFQLQALWRMVAQLKGRSPSELAALGQSFASANFLIDPVMGPALEELLK